MPMRRIAKIWLMIRLTTVILIATFMQVSAAGFAQKITLSRSNAPLKGVLKELKNQSGYVFLFTETQLKMAKPVNLKVTGQDFQEVLKAVFENQPLTYNINEKTITIKEKEKSIIDKVIDYFLNIDVKGKVVDENGEPLVGASVTVKGTNRLVTTNEKGEFSFMGVDEKAMLVISYIGYEIREIPVKADFGNVAMQMSTGKLDEVSVMVSTGYQSLAKERSTGSFTYIDNKKFNEQISTDVLSRLESTANGLVFDRARGPQPQITIRGLSTVQASMMEPLIVLDNFPYDGDINNINPNDVESITILKDAAAASIWGAKAANGVIIITTKKGKFNQPLAINFSVNATIADKPDLFYKKQMSSSDFIDVEQMLFEKGYYTSQINSASKPVLSPVVELLIKRNTSSQTDIQLIDQQINSLRNRDVRNDFNRYIYQRPLKQQYSLTAQGGSALMGWNLSVGYDRNLDNLNAGYDRLNLRFQNVLKPVKNLEITSGLTFSQSSTNSGKQGYGNISSKGSSIYPYAAFADDSGNAIPMAKDWRYNYIETVGGGKLLDWKYYPLDDYRHLKNSSKLSDLLANVGLNYHVVAGLNLDIKYQYERQSGNNELFQGQESYYARNMINGYTQIGSLGEVIYRVPKGAVVSYADNLMQSNNLRGQLNFNRDWGRHSVTAIAGSELRQSNPIGHTSRIYGFDMNTLTSGTVDFTLQYPNYVTGNRSFIDNGISISDRLTRFVSVYANAAYSYSDKYTISLSARRDASNLFGFQTNDRWNPLWSIGAAWELSKEDFYGKSALYDLLPYVKIRTTYGFSGNIHPSMAAATTIQYEGNSLYTMSPYAHFNNYANPDLKWETTGMLNLGLDFRSANNRVSGSVEYYRKKSKDLFATFPVDYTGGVGTTITKNAANMEGEGFDILFQSLNINADFKWNTELNFSANQDKITNFYLSSERGSAFMAAVPTLTGVIGKPVYSMLAYRWAGLDPQNGSPRGYLNGEVSSNYANLTGVQTTLNDLEYYGSAIPTVFGSVGNTFSWKGFSASVRIMYKLGYYFRKSTISYSGLFANWNGHSDYANRWQKPGDELITNIPAMAYPASSPSESFYSFSAPNILKADHVRLQYINIAYQLNKSNNPKLPFKSAQFFINLSNLGILWQSNREGIDPDYDFGSSTLKPPKTYSAGIRLNM